MTIEATHYLNIFLGSGAILLQVLALFALLLLVLRVRESKYLDFIKNYYVWIGFLISLFAVGFSMVYSEVVGFPPCYLCWYQRIFLFPAVFILGAELWRRENLPMKILASGRARLLRQRILHGEVFSKNDPHSISIYLMPMLLVGFATSLYMNFVYYFGGDRSLLPCDASGISCYQHLVSEFGGYISIPMLSLTSFFVLIVLLLVVRFYKGKSS